MGLKDICKIYGGMKINGVEWVYDYKNDKPRLKSEMTKEEFAESEKIKYENLKEQNKTYKGNMNKDELKDFIEKGTEAWKNIDSVEYQRNIRDNDCL